MIFQISEVRMQYSDPDLLVFEVIEVKFCEQCSVKKVNVLACDMLAMITLRMDAGVDIALMFMHWIHLFVQDQLRMLMYVIIHLLN
ncbi:MAG: hypothetical protein EZS28_033161 [Streblomastix strix]|uniref:Uncharacterized protein n=1 Tax=Streblomastix strix TaxID=222440 RepID=A0A5J4UMR6_9EUKA|nr:MAG: hypothetical protein EZS28_033161 [Streblomastix strix]